MSKDRDTTHVRMLTKTRDRNRLMSKVEDKDMTIIYEEMSLQREKEKHNGDIASRARDLGVGESE
jgi:hypothetical protein